MTKYKSLIFRIHPNLTTQQAHKTSRNNLGYLIPYRYPNSAGHHITGASSNTARRRRGGGWLKGEDSEIMTEERETPVWTPKPPKPEKPTEEIIVDVIEFSHASFISFIEFTIAWLDDKSGDYRY